MTASVSLGNSMGKPQGNLSLNLAAAKTPPLRPITDKELNININFFLQLFLRLNRFNDSTGTTYELSVPVPLDLS